MKADVAVGLQHGDEGKGKVVKELSTNNYDYCLRFNGGPNAGHTLYHNGKKIILHQIPCGIINNVTSIIGSGCVIDLRKLKIEINELKTVGVHVDALLKISHNAHIITEKHINEDSNFDKIGSTKSGIRPVYRDKYDRESTRICDLRLDELFPYIGDIQVVDLYELFKSTDKILGEGAQGFELDIDYGNYPFVTSSNCISSGVCTSCIPFKSIEKIYGICKIYDTYVGNRPFQGDDDDFKRLSILGEEIGATTSRQRQINWLNITKLKKAILVNSVTHLIINKCDIIQQLNVYKLIDNDQIIEFSNFKEMKKYIIKELNNKVFISNINNIIFSANKDKI